jgi:anti-sigma factor RsiW
MSHPSDEQLNDYIERALAPADHVAVMRHLEGCAECADAVSDLERIIREASMLGPLAPPEAVWTRLERTLKTETTSRPRWTMVPVWALSTAALVVLAFFVGRFVEHRSSPVQQAATTNARPVVAEASATVRERVLLVAVNDHLERSQMVLVELANADPRDALDISAERQSADELLASNRLYRQTAVQMGDTQVADVLDDLERVLVEIARGPSQLSIQQLAAVQQRIESQGILFKVRVIRNNTVYR